MDHLITLASIMALPEEEPSKYNTINFYVPYILVLVIIYVGIGVVFQIINNQNEKQDKLNLSFDYYGKKEGIQVIHNELTADQSKLRLKFLVARTLVQAATWIKAPYMFALYNRLHGFNRREISILYCVAQITSLCLGPLFGSLCDLLGRKKFCVLYNFVLAIHIGLRLTGNKILAYPAEFLTGICQILIDTAFESWLNFEANLLFENDDDGKRQKNSYLREIFAKQIGIDCFSSIALTGVSTFLYVTFSIYVPFYFCIATSVITGIYIMITWNENNMNLEKALHKEASEENQSLSEKLTKAMETIKNDKPLLAVGIIESCFKIALVLFMFMWTPLLEETAQSLIHPGSIFVCFMLARLAGSELFQGIKKTLKTNTYILSIFITVTGTLSFYFEYVFNSFNFIFIMLIYFDGLSGLLFPLMSSLKSQMIPEKLRTTIMTFFRIPINISCILTLFFSSYISTYQICLICFGIMLISAVINILLFMWHSPPDAEKRTVTTTTKIERRRSSNKGFPLLHQNLVDEGTGTDDLKKL